MSSTNDRLQSQDNLEIVIRKCIPKELISPSWKCDRHAEHLKNVESLMAKGNHQLDIFQSPARLLHDIMSYVRFPKCWEYFDLHFLQRIEPVPETFTSLKNQMYIYKNQLPHWYDYAYTSCPLKKYDGVVAAWILRDCWKVLEAGDNHELIVLPDEPHVCKGHVLNRILPNLQAFEQPIPSDHFEEFKRGWKNDMDMKIGTMSDVILESLDKHLEQFPVDKSSETISKIISWAGFCMSRVAHCVKQQSIHLPPLNTITPTEAIIRLFTIEKNNVVMAHELLKTLKTLNGMDVAGLEKEVLKMPQLSTLSFREIAQKIDKEVMKNLEFVKVNITLNMFAQTPIPTTTGGFCILVADAIFDLLMDMIVAKKVFQTIEKKDWIHIKEFFKSMSESYFGESSGIYFIDLKDLEIIKNKWEEVYTTHFKKSSKFVKKSKKTTGLKETLKFLELDNCFGDIMKYADYICSKSHKNLSPHALQKSILCCQVNSLVRKLPTILEFIHNQGSCDRLAIIGCELCSGGSIAEEITEIVQPEKKTKKTKRPKKFIESKNDVPTVTEAPEPAPQDSEASEFTSEENETLKFSDAVQLEIEQLKQDRLDKDERVRMLEKLLEEKGDVIKEQEKKLIEQAEIHKESIRILENLLDTKDDVIKEQAARIITLENEKTSQDTLSKLQAINTTLQSEQPVSKCTEIVNQLINNTDKEKIRSIAKNEMKRFCDEANDYSTAVENRITMIQCPPELPEFLVFSAAFLKVYEQTMKSKAPTICPQLLKPEEPEECVICLETLEPEDETKKCEVCNSRNHKECMGDWLKVNRTCPSCRTGIVDDEEFPPLG